MDRAPAKDRLLDAAAELFYRQGVSATGIDTITAHAGVAKMSLYNNFSSKADLVRAYLERRLNEWQSFYKQRLEAAKTPKEKVLAVFDSYVDHAALSYQWGFRGCGLLNAAAELDVDDPARSTVIFQKEEAERLFREHLAELRPSDTDWVNGTAEHLSFLLEGAMARSGLEGHDGRLISARRIALSLLETA
jgi:AcrR family transcriptional regulator